MTSISVNDFVTMFLKNNKELSKESITEALEDSVLNKKNGAKCHCGQKIWAIGSAIVGWNGCFTCITGEADNSNDYEIDEVNF